MYQYSANSVEFSFTINEISIISSSKGKFSYGNTWCLKDLNFGTNFRSLSSTSAIYCLNDLMQVTDMCVPQLTHLKNGDKIGFTSRGCLVDEMRLCKAHSPGTSGVLCKA